MFTSSVHIVHIALSNIYASATNKQYILDIMVGTYGRHDWNHREGKEINIHENFNSGKAYFRTLCNSKFSFGVSTWVQGNYNLDAIVMCDVFVIAHESGHSFGSRHTHDVEDYNVSCLPYSLCKLFHQIYYFEIYIFWIQWIHVGLLL